MIKKIIASALALTFALSGASLALAISDGSTELNINAHASTSVGNDRNLGLKVHATTTASTTVSITNAKARADQAIANRISDLNKLKARVDAMVKLSASQKASLDASIQASITDMNNLKVKIDADTDANVLKTDIASITASYRIYMLVMPQVAIAAASDRINTIVDMMTTIGAKFQTRISAAASAGKNVTSLQASLSDYNAKIADAKVQANAAASSTIALTPDHGDKTKAAANHQVLVDARAKIKVAQDDLKAARKDADNILKGLKAFGNIGVTTSSTTH